MEPDILDYASKMDCKELHLSIDNANHLKAIVAIHNTNLGPALGGCRFLEYPSTAAAALDAIRLAKAMTYKAAMAHLPLGGGKLVLLKPKEIVDRTKYFNAVADFLNGLHGRYITAVDSGTSTLDMDILAAKSAYVTSTTSSGDPSFMTAEGVEKGILAAVKFKLGKSNLKGLHVAIQGAGHAGYNLAKYLHLAGAKLSVYDVNLASVNKCVVEFGAKKVDSVEKLFGLECDVLAPCALGSVLNDQSISLIKAPVVAGCANNQLLESRHGQVLMERNIVYAPDYVINSGGLIYVAAKYGYIKPELAAVRVNDIYDTLIEIFTRSQLESQATSDIADTIAQEKLRV